MDIGIICGELVTCEPSYECVLHDVVLKVDDKRIFSIDEELGNVKKVIDARDKTVMPGFIDSHTHLIFGGNRANEFEEKLKGIPYEEILKRGGGIFNTVSATRKTDRDTLKKLAIKWIRNAFRWGTTTIEIKSGYGLDKETELKLLKIINELKNILKIRVIPTFLVHVVPKETERKKYITEIKETWIREFREFAEFFDVFCDPHAISLDETKELLETAQKYGYKIKLHAEQLAHYGGAKLASKFNAISCDHLEYADEDDIKLLKEKGVVPVLLPGAYLYLGCKKAPPIELLRKHKVGFALATDFNPGSSPIISLLIIMNLACTLWKITPLEAILGVTYYAAKSLGLNELGSIAPGKFADIIILNTSSYKEIPYWCGFNPVEKILVNGKEIQDIM